MAIEESIKRVLDLTDWQAITKKFPGSTFDSEQKSFMVVAFHGRPYENEQIQRNIANIISRIEARVSSLSIQRRPQGTSATSNPSPATSAANIIDELAAEYGAVASSSTNAINNDQAPLYVIPDQVKLISPSEAKVMLYPRGLRCPRCDYYIIHTDMSKHRSLDCPRCGKDRLRQISNLFFCLKCGSQHEITPRFTEPEKDGPIFRCTEPGGCDGHLLLKLERPLSKSRWVCDKTGTEVDRVVYSCPTCARWTGVRDPAFMKLVSTTESYMKPLTLSTVYVSGNLEFSLGNFSPSWSLKKVPKEIRDIMSGYGIRDMQVIDDIESFTVVYGYTSYGADALPKTFKRRNQETRQYEYPAYMTRSKGKGLLILLDKERAAKVALEELAAEARIDGNDHFLRTVRQYLDELEDDSATAYAWLAGATKDVITAHQTTPRTRTALFKLLHSV